MGALKYFDPATQDWQIIPTQGPVGALGPTGPVGPPSGGVNVVANVGGGTNVVTGAANAMTDLQSVTAHIKPDSQYMITAGFRCVQDEGAGNVQVEVGINGILLPTHSVIGSSADMGLFGAWGRTWIRQGSAFAATEGDYTFKMRASTSTASMTIYAPEIALIELNDPNAPVGGGGATGPIALDDLTDVAATGPTDGQVLTWDSTALQWVPEAPSAGGGGGGGNVITDAAENMYVEGQVTLLNPLGSGGNTAFGDKAGQGLTSGAGNTIIGNDAGWSLSTGFNNTLIGQSVSCPVDSRDNTLIGAGAAGTANDCVFVGYNAGQSNALDIFSAVAIGDKVGASKAVAINGVAGAENSIAIGYGTSVAASAAGSVAIGTDDTDQSATATLPNQIVLGTSLHNVAVAGVLAVRGTPVVLQTDYDALLSRVEALEARLA